MTDGGITPEFVHGQLRLVALSVLTLAFVVFLQGNGIDRLRKRYDGLASTVDWRLSNMEQWVTDHAPAPAEELKAKPRPRPARKATEPKAVD